MVEVDVLSRLNDRSYTNAFPDGIELVSRHTL